MFGLDLAHAAVFLVLAGNAVQCTVPEAPKISIDLTSDPVRYEFSMSGQQLTALKSNTVSPYAPGTDTTTGGLRHDRPEIRTEVQWGIRQYEDRQIACLWYKAINIKIHLSPKIYVAKEQAVSKTCREAILGHELKHVNVDREVINKYAQGIGNRVKEAVDAAGALGPYNYHEIDQMQKKLVGHVEAAVDSQTLVLSQEMSKRQGQVDSLEEYERVSALCEGR